MFIYITAYLVVFLLGATPFMEVLGAIPIGAAAGLPAIPVTVLAFLGNMFTIWLLLIAAERFKRWRQKRREAKGLAKTKKMGKRGEAVWKKYGIPGLAMTAPVLVGSHFAVAFAIGAGGDRKQIFFWITLSIMIWTLIISLASYFGLDYLFEGIGYDGFIKDLLEVD